MKQELSDKSVKELIADLGSNDGMVRQRARQELVGKGETVVDDLIHVFREKTEPLHFEAAKALSQISNPKAIEAFIEALEDEEFSVRWVAAEGLAAIGVDSIKPLLKMLEHHSDAILVRDGAHHVLHDLVSRKLVDEKTGNILQSVIDSYHHLGAEIYIPVAAKNALDKL